MHVAVAPVGDEDKDAPSKFSEALANRPGSKTKHVGTEWVDINQLLNYRWRKSQMHWHAGLMVVASRDALNKHAPVATPVCGEKRSRDALSDDELTAAAEAAEAAARLAAVGGSTVAGEVEGGESSDDAIPGGEDAEPDGSDDTSDSESGSGSSGCETPSEEESEDSDDADFISD